MNIVKAIILFIISQRYNQICQRDPKARIDPFPFTDSVEKLIRQHLASGVQIKVWAGYGLR